MATTCNRAILTVLLLKLQAAVARLRREQLGVKGSGWGALVSDVSTSDVTVMRCM